jgi:hypothetical protein
MVTTMGVPSIVTFEMEVVKPNLKYQKRQIMRRLEKPQMIV